MDFSLSEEHKMVQQMVRVFAAREIAPTVADHDRRQEPDRALLQKLGAQGILGLCIPVRYGGSGMDYISLGLACEELERVDTSARVIMSVHVALNSMALLQWATEEQKERFLAPQARGEKLAGFGLTEPGAGSDVAGLSATARREGDTYILNGEKMWISLATLADHFLVVARTDPTAGVRGMTAFVVEQQMPGFTSGSIHGKLGVRAGDTGWIAMQDTPVPLSHRLGEEGEGFKIAMSCLDNG
ncbi:MAG: acyl-CoA dehydrogenase family protein, partial [Anaerolineae bacterium]